MVWYILGEERKNRNASGGKTRMKGMTDVAMGEQ